MLKRQVTVGYFDYRSVAEERCGPHCGPLSGLRVGQGAWRCHKRHATVNHKAADEQYYLQQLLLWFSSAASSEHARF
jgi:ribosomal protein L37AE/L43A